jgi:L-ascorbate metabolism protein UlaG (beta-lactamase superfamily)
MFFFKKTLSLALTLTLGIVLATTSVTAQAQATAGKTELLWLGQAGFKIKSPGGKTIVIDPWLTGGPKTPAPYKTDIAALGKVDLLLVTHAHVDHIGDAPAIAKAQNTV